MIIYKIRFGVFCYNGPSYNLQAVDTMYGDQIFLSKYFMSNDVVSYWKYGRNGGWDYLINYYASSLT